MPGVFFKRALMWSIPAALISLAIQYHHSGKTGVYVVVLTLVIFVLGGLASEWSTYWWKRVVGTRKFAFIASVVFWIVLVICLFVLFYRMS
ncbi:hypothetical protein PQQ51_26975 [Paraburkholderia xenovorans]|uniref:hypothetical protein n=1 Tax=Paraburkholderia xenovorans TaxID=36873 RepID=UPI0038BBB15A